MTGSDEDLDDALEELEERIEDVEEHTEHEATGMVPNHDHHEVREEITRLDHSLEQLTQQLVNMPASASYETVASLEARIVDLEARLADAREEVQTEDSGVEEDIELEEPVVHPKRQHWFTKLPRWV